MIFLKFRIQITSKSKFEPKTTATETRYIINYQLFLGHATVTCMITVIVLPYVYMCKLFQFHPFFLRKLQIFGWSE